MVIDLGYFTKGYLANYTGASLLTPTSGKCKTNGGHTLRVHLLLRMIRLPYPCARRVIYYNIGCGLLLSAEKKWTD